MINVEQTSRVVHLVELSDKEIVTIIGGNIAGLEQWLSDYDFEQWLMDHRFDLDPIEPLPDPDYGSQ